MTERRSNPVDRCPEHTKDLIARICIHKLSKRIIESTKYTKKEVE